MIIIIVHNRRFCSTRATYLLLALAFQFLSSPINGADGSEKSRHSGPLVGQLSEANPIGGQYQHGGAGPTYGKYDARRVSEFLESHLAHSIHDPRVYFSEERTTRSMAIMRNDFAGLPPKFGFAFLVRAINELGRKIATKLNLYSSELTAILSKLPDALGNKPEVSMLVDVVDRAFESKEDGPLKDEVGNMTIGQLIHEDEAKATLFNSSLDAISVRLAQTIYYFARFAIPKDAKSGLARDPPHVELLCAALRDGFDTLIEELKGSDIFRVPDEIVGYALRILQSTSAILRDSLPKPQVHIDATVRSRFQVPDGFRAISPISDRTGLVGAWNNYLFSNLGSAERVVKVFACLLSRVAPSNKSRWINMYSAQVQSELNKTLTSFVVMQTKPIQMAPSHTYLTSGYNITETRARRDYIKDKKRVPARCYLAGRRWRAILFRAMSEYPAKEEAMKKLIETVSQFKQSTAHKSGNDQLMLCLPQLEVGLRGWSMSGDPISKSDDGGELKDSIRLGEKLGEDPFLAGVRFGYKIGFKVGYNEARNASLEMVAINGNQTDETLKARAEIAYLAMASYRKGATAGARRSFSAAIRAGYLQARRASLRSGIVLAAQQGSQFAQEMGANSGAEAGQEAGKLMAQEYIVGKDHLSEEDRVKFLELGEMYGRQAGTTLGAAIAAIAGRESAEESFRRSIGQAGELVRLKFLFDLYTSGCTMGFDYGLEEGTRVASSSTLDPSAPHAFRFDKPTDFDDLGDKVDGDQWTKDLMPPLSEDTIESFHMRHEHQLVDGKLTGHFNLRRQLRDGLRVVKDTRQRYSLDVTASGYIWEDTAYIKLNGTVDRRGQVSGFMVIDKWDWK